MYVVFCFAMIAQTARRADIVPVFPDVAEITNGSGALSAGSQFY
jgi:hypothetical protein